MKCIILLLIPIIFPLTAISQHDSTKQKLVSDYYSKGIALRSIQKDSSYHFFDLAYDYSLQLEEYSDAMEVLISSILTSTFHYDLKTYQTYLEKFENLLNGQNLDSIRNPEYYKNRFIFEKAAYLYKLKDYENAKDYFQRFYAVYAPKNAEDLGAKEYGLFVHATNYLGLIYTNTGKYDLAENYFKRSLAFVKNNVAESSKGLERATLHLLSKLYTLTDRHNEAEYHLKNVVVDYEKRYLKDKEYKNNVIAAYQKLVRNAIDQHEPLKALTYLKRSRTYLLEEDPFYKESLLLYGDIYLNLGEEQKALHHYEKALRFFMKYRDGEAHQDIAAVYGKIAEFHLRQKKYQEGLKTIENAFKTSGNSIKLSNDQENPNPEEVFSKTQLLYLLDVKLQLLQGNHEKTADNALRRRALKTSNDILKTFDVLKREFDSKLDKQFLAEKAYPIFHRILEVLHKAYEQHPSPETLQLALNTAEKSKDFVLLEALRNVQATKYGNVPQEVLNREARLRAEITYLEKEIFDTAKAQSGYSDALFELKQEYYGFLDTIKTKYPKYHELKYRTTTLDLKTIRNKLLNGNGTLISYTLTGNQLYAIVLNGNDGKFLKLPFSDGDSKAIRDFYEMLSNPSIGETEKGVAALGEKLFRKILKNPLEGFDAENLTIIPDGELHYLPFDLLRKNGSYLLQTKNVGYGNSVTSLLGLKERKKARTNKILAFAPSFANAVVPNTDRQFGKLLYNDDEVSKIGAFFDTETVLDEKATLTNFRAKTSGFNMLHLATHASANDEFPDYSYLAFSDEATSDQGRILYIKDLYNTTLNADMVTLSACQTGIGKLQKGQGMLSLSKGFYYAGAKALVNTLWKINDKSSVRLMAYFYEGLSQGKSKTKALRDAKLRYLQTTDDDLLRHPYYWSAFVVSGDVSPVAETHYWWYVGAGVLFFGVLFLMSKQKQKIKKFKRIVLRTTS